MSYENPRIKDLSMTYGDMILAMSDGNPGAAVALCDLIKTAPQIDPDSALGGLGPLSMLDSLDIYGPRIWMLYKDVCGQDAIKTVAVLRCCQMGITSGRNINAAISGDKSALDIPALIAELKEKLPAFAAPRESTSAA